MVVIPSCCVLSGVFNLTRWNSSSFFPRIFPLHNTLFVESTTSAIAKGGELSGHLQISSEIQYLKLGLISLEWSEWLPALLLVPIEPTWVWVFSKKWERILRRCFPCANFVNGFDIVLPPVDILLLSKVTLAQCQISLDHCPCSVILATTRLRDRLGWIRRFWDVKHAFVGGCTDGHWRIHSLHRSNTVYAPNVNKHDELPSGTIRRVVNSTISRGKVVLAPSTDILQAIDGMYSIANTATSFLLPSVFSTTGWVNRQLTIDELLQLWDYSPALIKTLAGNHRKWLFCWKAVPPRVLGFVLRLFIIRNCSSEGVGRGINIGNKLKVEGGIEMNGVETGIREGLTVDNDIEFELETNVGIELEKSNVGMNVGRKSKNVGTIRNVDVDLDRSAIITNSNISSHIVNSNISSHIINEDSCDSVRIVQEDSCDSVRLSKEDNDSYKKVVDICNRKCLHNNKTSNNCKLSISNPNIKSTIVKRDAGDDNDTNIIMKSEAEEENDTKVVDNDENVTKVVDNRKCLHKVNRKCLYDNNTSHNCKLSISKPNIKSIIMKSEVANGLKVLNTSKATKTMVATNTSANTVKSKAVTTVMPSKVIINQTTANTSTNTVKSKVTNILKPSKVIINQTTTNTSKKYKTTANTLKSGNISVSKSFENSNNQTAVNTLKENVETTYDSAIKTDINPDAAIILQTPKVKSITKNYNEINNNIGSGLTILLQTSKVKSIT